MAYNDRNGSFVKGRVSEAFHNYHHLKVGALSFAAAIASSILYSLCVAFLVFMPEQALNWSAMTHQLSSLDMLAPYVKVTAMSYFAGLIATFVCAYLLVWLTGTIYHNMVCRRLEDKYE